ncbi:MAG TPA: DUF445 domain-containing protein [Cytophagales bacterium]|jgi:uncharacterized membrane protein YheB (UPF0754 family)|nr:DUF445 domain-containing protein [Cytophagales bacterium]
MIYTLPLIAAITGWITNFLAIKMLFHPKRKINLYIFSIQGIFPKRQHLLAEKLGHIVATELFSFKDIKDNFTSTETAGELNKVLDEKIEDFIAVKLKSAMPMLAMFLNDELKTKIKNTLHEEFQNILPELLNTYTEKLENDIDVEKIVADKVSHFSSDKLEQILYSIMRKEFKFIEILGGFLGFLIGLIQLIIVKWQYL